MRSAVPTVDHDRLDHVIYLVAAGDRTAFRRLYAFMAMRVWQIAAMAPLGLADADAVTRSTFVEVWHSAGAGTRYDARDWMATVTTGRVNDRLRIIDANDRYRVCPAEPCVGADRQIDYDAHVHHELTGLLGAGGATIRTGPGVFARIDDLDHALATIAAATWAAATGSC
jgi:DNA-directed RNA polymerase specialized sigma24 family protein